MDRKLLAACAGAASLSAAALAFGWQDRAPQAPGQFAIQPSKPLAAERCSWQEPEGSFVEAAEPLDAAGEAEIAAERSQTSPPARPVSVRRESSATVEEPAAPLVSSRARVSPPATRIARATPSQQPVVAAEAVGGQPSSPSGPEFSAPSGIGMPIANEPPQMVLPWANANRYTPEMIAVLTRADERVRHGFSLASRGALLSAKSEFVRALQIIAEANDTQQGTRMYTKALAAGMTALKEASVFVRQRTNNAPIDVARVVTTHKTTILKDYEGDDLTATYAAQRYYTYAQEQLAAAAAREMNGSMALFGLGKAALTDVANHTSQPAERTAQAMAYFQAAMLAEPHNFLAANELAVLEAKNGNLMRARELLVHSAGESNQRATWYNLSVVHSRLGEAQLSEQAKAHLATLPPEPGRGPVPTVKWLDPETFASTMVPSDGLVPQGMQSGVTPPAPGAAPQPGGTMAKGGAAGWLPWNTRR